MAKKDGKPSIGKKGVEWVGCQLEVGKAVFCMVLQKSESKHLSKLMSSTKLSSVDLSDVNKATEDFITLFLESLIDTRFLKLENV